MQQYELIALKSFVSVVETGSFNKTAVQLQASTAAISRRVSGLEQALGVKLLNRTTRSIDLTEAGQQYYNDIIHILQALEEAEERVSCSKQALKGTLRIAAPLSYGLQQIAPLLPPFMKQYPDLKMQLQLEDRYTDLISEGIDVAIRIGNLKDSTMVATRITSIERVICASPGYLAQYGTPKHPEELKNHNCLHYNLISRSEEWGLIKQEGNKNIEISGTLSTNNGEVLKQAALQGTGIVLLPKFIVQDALKTGDLSPILESHTPEPTGLFAIRPSRAFTPTRVALFIDYMKSIYPKTPS